jgi:hypothetical protein
MYHGIVKFGLLIQNIFIEPFDGLFSRFFALEVDYVFPNTETLNFEGVGILRSVCLVREV